MLVHHLPSTFRGPWLRPISRLVVNPSYQHRSISSFFPRRSEQPPGAPSQTTDSEIPEGLPETAQASLEELEALDLAPESEQPSEGESDKGPTTYGEFINQIGHKYQYADKPHNWLAPNTPFPMNPSFKPPPPISDAQKEWMFHKFFGDPLVNTPRKIAGSLNMSLKRVDAILRLKGLERQFIKNTPLQTGFQRGMEKILDAYTHPRVLGSSKSSPTNHPNSRSDVDQADLLERAEKRDAARYRYEKLYWESTPEDGREPVLPGILEDVKTRMERRELARKKRASMFLMKRAPKNPWVQRPSSQSFLVTRPGRVSTRFVDVGAQFLDVDDILKRTTARRHRRELHHKRLAKKQKAVDQDSV